MEGAVDAFKIADKQRRGSIRSKTAALIFGNLVKMYQYKYQS